MQERPLKIGRGEQGGGGWGWRRGVSTRARRSQTQDQASRTIAGTNWKWFEMDIPTKSTISQQDIINQRTRSEVAKQQPHQPLSGSESDHLPRRTNQCWQSLLRLTWVGFISSRTDSLTLASLKIALIDSGCRFAPESKAKPMAKPIWYRS